ncbi:MAG: hypothetical protein A3B14_00560 [Candidatus Zambryskibacteria bacterium RIFCSPLOWO2_01_FULL_45_21]|uniref:Uncharacterized protein n=1 Tax=Candidatus Zambryskibacteria bacterium RIFCSPLOWO2_01_FULL_45_21 TaxID=1802761 RepID=A0A1G2U186_9BACT|nr:MAG: hypothetical protein A3B14_00560 [Candidatus Zambryskibacteria bacterium RIFCSPLOWO2_01_FULL_45_21]
MESFLLWWSVISTILGVIFLVANAVQLALYVKEKSLILKEKEIHKSQVKVWQHHANGIQMGLLVGSLGKFSAVDDLRELVKAIQQDAQSLHKSLTEERLFTDEEIKERMLNNEKETQERLRAVGQRSQHVPAIQESVSS